MFYVYEMMAHFDHASAVYCGLPDAFSYPPIRTFFTFAINHILRSVFSCFSLIFNSTSNGTLVIDVF